MKIPTFNTTGHPEIAPISRDERDEIFILTLRINIWLMMEKAIRAVGFYDPNKVTDAAIASIWPVLRDGLSSKSRAWWAADDNLVREVSSYVRAKGALDELVHSSNPDRQSLEDVCRRIDERRATADAAGVRELKIGLQSFMFFAAAAHVSDGALRAGDAPQMAAWFRKLNKTMFPKGYKGLQDRFFDLLSVAASGILRASPSGAPSKSSQRPPTTDVTYRIPTNYWPWRVVRAFMDLAKDSDFDQFIVHGSNFYLLGEQFLQELEDTDLMIDDLRIMEEAPLPHPCFLWLPPLGFLNVKTPTTSHQVGGLLVTLMQEDGRNGVGVDLFSHVRADDFDFEAVTYRYFFDDNGVLIANTEDELGAAVLRLLLKVLVSMAAAPKIVECEATESVRPPKKGKRGLEFRTPRVIGWKIRYVRTGGSAKKRPLEKGHVEPHWRRRHIKRVPYGPMSVPLEERPRRIAVVERTRVNSEYEKTK